MSGKRQKNQNQLAFWFAGASEACFDGQEGTVTPVVERETESPAGSWQLMEEVVERENLIKALKRVQANDGSPGVDGMTVDELPGYLKGHWTVIREQLMSGTYKPQPVRRHEIEKQGGGMRKFRFLDPDGGCRRIFWEVVWHLFFWEPGVQSHKMDQRDTRQRWSCSDSHSFRVFRMAPLKSASQSAF